MAAVAPAADKATEILQNLSLDAAKTKNNDVPEPTKKPPIVQHGTMGNIEVTNMPIPSYDRSITPVMQDYIDPNMCYVPNYAPPAYFYGGYEGSINEWDDFPRYLSPDGVDMSHSVYGDAYQGYGYAPYGAYPPGSPVPTVGHDGHLYGPQHYQYPGAYYPPPVPTSSVHTPTQPPSSQGENTTSVAPDQPPLGADMAKPDSNGIANSNGKNEPVNFKANQKNSALTSNGTYGRNALPGGVPSGYQIPRYGSPGPWLDGSGLPDWHHRPITTSTASTTVSHASSISSARNQNLQPLPLGLHHPGPPSGMGPAGPGFMNRMYPNSRLYGQCANALRTGHGFLSNGYDSRANGRSWLAMDGKYRARGRGNGFYGYGNENMEHLNELNRGPRSGRLKNNQKILGPNVVIAVKGQSLPSNANCEDSSLVLDREQYNRPDFPEKYTDAKFFVIKSYSEDDVHKSVKYSVWASTPNGNKKLDAGYQEAQEKSDCPVFLFFSVNTSGQFIGVAEMVGPVDFNKTMDYWQQPKWNGCLPVKWHIVKDVPNGILKHITLENNDNKPVTNSRDTQEVKFDQGILLLKLFKDYVSKTNILDDFGFYETRQKAMQEKRAKQQFQKQVWDGKVAGATVVEKDGAMKPRIQKPLEVTSVLNKETGQSKLTDQNDVVNVSGEATKVVKAVPEKRILANGVSNGIANGVANGFANGVSKGC